MANTSRKTSELSHGIPKRGNYFDYVDTEEPLAVNKDKTCLIDTIYDLIEEGGSGGGFYTNLNPTPDQTGHIASGTTFDTVAIPDMFDMLLYSLMASFSAQNTPRRLGSTNVVVLDWSVTKAGDPITGITVAGQTVVPTGNSQSGTVNTLATQNVDTIFAMTVTDGANIVNKSTIVTWLNDRYWGAVTVDGNGATANTLSDLVSSPPTDAQIQLNLSNELASSRAQSRNGINGAGGFLTFAWPSRFNTPTFVVNGLPNSAFTKVRSASNFVNESDYTETYDVWVSNTKYNSAVATFAII